MTKLNRRVRGSSVVAVGCRGGGQSQVGVCRGRARRAVLWSSGFSPSAVGKKDTGGYEAWGSDGSMLGLTQTTWETSWAVQ